jgi:hypothetical protein
MSEYFIITAGPTGSGKTKLVQETLKILGIPNESFKKYLIDDYVENDPIYKEKVKQIIKGVEEKCSKSDDIKMEDCVKNTFNHPPDALFDEFKAAYYEVRRKGCSEQCLKRKAKQIDCDGCNIALNHNLKNLSKNNSISKVAVFETTGSSIPRWLLTDSTYVPPRSKIVISYSLVNIHELIKRNKSRAYQSVLEFKQNPSNPAPRLPNVKEDTFRKIIADIRHTLLDLYKSCILQRDVKCGDRPIHQFILFDNNGPSHKLIYNSMDEHQQNLTNAQFEEIVNQSLGDKMNGGKKKRKTRTRRMRRGKMRRGKTRKA